MLRFFGEAQTEKSLARLAKADTLTVFVGAGASKEVGLPSWGELVERLAKHLVAKNKKKLSNDDEAVVEFISNSGALAAAERIAGSMSENDLTAQIRIALYGRDKPGDLLPGPLVRAVAHLRKSQPNQVTVVTTNYDQLLVQALRDVGVSAAKSYCTQSRRPGAVIHLHGVVGFAKPADGENQIVLTEGHFLAPQAGGWRRDVVERALGDGPCLFLGVSLTDLNLLRPLHNSTSKHRHVLIYTRDPNLPQPAVAATERIERVRWGKLKVDCLFADNYADSSVFVRELARRRTEPDSERLPERVEEWHSQVVAPYTPAAPADYEKIQATLSSQLHDLLAAVQADHGMGGEVMQLGLFTLGVHDGVESVQVLATSDRVMKDPRSSERFGLRLPTNWTGVKAMCSAVPISERKAVYASRWKQMLAVPICLDSLSATCVGAVVLSSTSEQSSLDKVSGSGLVTMAYAKLYDALEDAGKSLLEPA